MTIQGNLNARQILNANFTPPLHMSKAFPLAIVIFSLPKLIFWITRLKSFIHLQLFLTNLNCSILYESIPFFIFQILIDTSPASPSAHPTTSTNWLSRPPHFSWGQALGNDMEIKCAFCNRHLVSMQYEERKKICKSGTERLFSRFREG
jgi:hypothetical protein